MKYIYTFKDGHKCTSNLEKAELIKRMNRLDTLRVLTEGFEDGEGRNICDKALRAYNKTENFTGIIRLSLLEKDFLGYMLDSDMNSEEDIEVIKFYMGGAY